MQSLKEKQEKARLEALVDNEQTISELNHRRDMEKQMMLEDNNKLQSNVHFVSLLSCFFFSFVFVGTWFLLLLVLI